MIQSIETEYNGYRFRSRTEARWAVFFNAAGIAFNYEPEGFVLDGKPYLPDFWLPDAGLWLEVKGQSPTPAESSLCKRLATESGHDCLIAVGPPRQDGGVFVYYAAAPDGYPFSDGELSLYFADDRRSSGVFWLTDGQCGFSIINADDATAERYPLVHTATQRGYDAARSARFEFGENGPDSVRPRKTDTDLLKDQTNARRGRYRLS